MKRFNFEEAILDQYKFNRVILFRDGIDIDKISEEQLHHYLKEFSLHLADEVFEFLRHLNWKMHKKNRVPINRIAVLEELIDIFKFAFNMLLFLKIDEGQFKAMWDYKTKKVWRKWEDEVNKEIGLESLLHEDGVHGEDKIDL